MVNPRRIGAQRQVVVLVMESATISVTVSGVIVQITCIILTMANDARDITPAMSISK